MCRCGEHVEQRRVKSFFPLPFLSFLLSLSFLFLFLGELLLFPSGSGAAAPSPEVLFKVGEAVINWDGQSPGDLFGAVKKANPELPAIESMRALDAALKAGQIPQLGGYAKNIEARQRVAQGKVRQILLESRRKAFGEYAAQHPESARSLYGVGDIGSWTGGDPTIAMDADYTVFGVDAQVTGELQSRCAQQTLQDLGASDKGLALGDFDVVITAEGHEGEAHVFESEAGKDWARRNLNRFVPLDASGNLVSFAVEKGRGDVPGELAMAERLARIREFATRRGEYEKLFTEKGNLRNIDTVDPELLKHYAAFFPEMDFYKAKAETASGGCFDMAKHLKTEVLDKADQFKPEDLGGKILKYLERGDSIARTSGAASESWAQDPVLSDPGVKRALELARKFRNLRGEAFRKAWAAEFGTDPTPQEMRVLGENAARALEQMGKLAFRGEAERICKDPSGKSRQSSLERLARDFETLRDAYPEDAQNALRTLGILESANETGLLEEMQKSEKALMEMEKTPKSLREKARNYLEQTDFGRSLMRKYGALLEIGATEIPALQALDTFRTPQTEFMGDIVEESRSTGLKVMDVLGSAAMWADVLRDVRQAKSDAELAILLGKTLAQNTYYGMIATAFYAGIVEGDSEALSKAIMYLVVPETAMPALMAALGESAVSVTSAVLFDHQMEVLYLGASFSEAGELTGITTEINRFAGRSQAVSGFLDAVLAPGGDAEIQGLLAWVKKYSDPGLLQEYASSVNLFSGKGFQEVLESTVYGGKPLIMQDYGPLAQVCAAVGRTNRDIDDFAQAFSLGGIPKREGPSWVDEPSGDGSYQALHEAPPEVKRVLRKLMTLRATQWKEVKAVFAEGITLSFEERHAAEKQLVRGKEEAFALLKRMEEVFRKLGIEKEGMAVLNYEGTSSNLLERLFSLTDTEQRIRAMKTLQRYLGAYEEVLRIRGQILLSFVAVTGDQPLQKPLTGAPPLTGNPEFDLYQARKMLGDTANLMGKTEKTLEAIKKAPLEEGFDRTLAVRIYKIRFALASYEALREGAKKLEEQLWFYQWESKGDMQVRKEEAQGFLSTLREKERQAFDEFRAHYATPRVTPTLEPSPTPEPIPTLEPTPTPKPAPALSPTSAPEPDVQPTPKATATPVLPTPTPAVRPFSELSEGEIKDLLNCLCNCAIRAAPPNAGIYAPETRCGPDSKGGPCISVGTFGCWHAFIASSGECAENCLKRFRVDPEEAKAFIQKKNKEFEFPLEMELTSSGGRLLSGNVVTLKVRVSGGQGCYEYLWKGVTEDLGREAKVTLPCGEALDVSCTVRDCGGQSATASLSLEPEPFRVTCRRGGTGPVVVGQPVEFEAQVEGGAENLPPGIRVEWHPVPEVDFTGGGTGPKTSAIFTEPGSQKVWVQLLCTDNGTGAGESDPLEVSVELPKISLKALPPEPYVGQTVQVRLEEVPELSAGTLEYRWEIEGDVLRSGAEARDSRNFSFVPKKAEKVTVKASGITSGGADAGEASLEIAPKLYEVLTKVTGALITRPGQEWQGKDRLEEKTRSSFLTGEQVGAYASLKDYSEPSEVRWQWSVNAGTTLHSASTAQEVLLSRSEAGTAEVTVEARNGDNLLLGSGTLSFAVQSQEGGPLSPREPDLSVALEGLAETLQPGETLQMIARTTGGTPPYRYAWSENVRASGGTARFEAEAPGEISISLTVLDSKGKTAEVRKGLTVVPLEVRVELLGIFTPQGSPHKKGSEEIMAGDRVHLKGITSRRYPGMTYRWKAEGGVLFEGRTSGETVALYRNDEGSAAISLEILSPRGNLLGEGSYLFHVKQLRDPRGAQELLAQSQEAWKRGNYSEALSRILAAEKLDPENAQIREVREKLERHQEGQARALELRKEAEQQIREGKLEEALESYRESLSYAEDAETRRRLKALEDFAAKYRQAQELWQQAAKLQEHKYYREALEKYREGLQYYGDPRIEEHVRTLEQYLRKAEESERQKKEHARKLWKEGAELQKKERYEEALEKYRQGLEYYDDPQMREHVRKLEVYLGKPEEPSRPSPTPEPLREPTEAPRPSPTLVPPVPTEIPQPSPTSAPFPAPSESPLGNRITPTPEPLSDNLEDCGLAWQEIRRFGLVFEVPREWTFDEGGWHTGNDDNPDAVVGVTRETREDWQSLLGFLNPEDSRTVTVAGCALTLHISRHQDDGSGEFKVLAMGILEDPTSTEHVLQIGYGLSFRGNYDCVAERFLRSFRFE